MDLTLGTNLANGTHTVVINPTAGSTNNVKSLTGAYLLNQTLTVNYTADTTAPTATISKISQTSVTFTFSKPVKYFDSAKVRLNFNNDTYMKTSATYIKPVSATNGYSNTWTVDFSSIPIPAGNATFYVVSDLTNTTQDAWANKLADTSYTANVTVDTSDPTVTVTATDNTHFAIKFSKAVDSSAGTNGATNAANYTVNARGSRPTSRLPRGLTPAQWGSILTILEGSLEKEVPERDNRFGAFFCFAQVKLSVEVSYIGFPCHMV